VTQPPVDPGHSTHVVVRTTADIAHPHVNVWLPRGLLDTDAAGNLELRSNLQHTFEGTAQPTTEIEPGDDGKSAQVYRLVSAHLRTPPRGRRRNPPRQ
jgi:hypothetical protein